MAEYRRGGGTREQPEDRPPWWARWWRRMVDALRGGTR